MENILVTNNLTKSYKSTRAIAHCSVCVPAGAVYGLVGDPASGKTTFLRVICGLQQPTAGYYILLGVRNLDKSGMRLVREKIRAVIEKPALFEDLNALDNLRARAKVLDSNCMVKEILALVGMEDAGRQKVREMPLEMRQRLGIGIALLGKPELIILDQPMHGLDSDGMERIGQLIKKLRCEREISFIVTGRHGEELACVATDYAFMEQGRIIRQINARAFQEERQAAKRIPVRDMARLIRACNENGIAFRAENRHTALWQVRDAPELLLKTLIAQGIVAESASHDGRIPFVENKNKACAF